MQKALLQKTEALAGALKKMQDHQAEAEQELNEARRMQDSLLPKPANHGCGFKFEFMVEPSEKMGGDHIDIIDMGGSRKGVFLSDVSGHGMPAGFISGMVHAYLHARFDPGVNIASFVRRLNDYMYHYTPPEIYLAVFTGVLDMETGDLEYILAALPEPVMYRNGKGACFLPESESPVLGLYQDISCPISRIRLDAGDALYVYSDGLSDSFSDPDADPVSMEMLIARYHLNHRKEGLRWFLNQAVMHNGKELPSDDLSILLISRDA